jgi:alpha-galactosidase
MQRTSFIQATGLCHSVQSTARMLTRWLGLKPGSLDYVCAGLNHMSWYLKLEHRGRDLYPRLRRRVETDRRIYNEEPVRNEMFLALGYYVTESGGHNSEYNWWFRKRPDLLRTCCARGTGWNPGLHAYTLNAYRRTERNWKRDVRRWLAEGAPMPLARGYEYAASIANAYLGGELFQFNGNVPNAGAVSNLPPGACVEVPVLASRRGFAPLCVGALPPSVAMLTHLTAQTEMLAVEGALRADPELIYQAICHDPLTAAKLSLREIRKMVAEMFRRNRRYLPQFKTVDF